MKNANGKKLVFWVLLAELTGALAAVLTRGGTELYQTGMIKPPLSPPAIVFPVVWTILYALMGIGAARIDLAPPTAERRNGLRLFLVQLLFNFLWSIFFFHFRAYGFSFLWLVVLWTLIVRMTLSFRETDPVAAWLQLPYLLWVLFAGYLNFGIWRLNR